jgi:hypothetical protein
MQDRWSESEFREESTEFSQRNLIGWFPTIAGWTGQHTLWLLHQRIWSTGLFLLSNPRPHLPGGMSATRYTIESFLRGKVIYERATLNWFNALFWGLGQLNIQQCKLIYEQVSKTNNHLSIYFPLSSIQKQTFPRSGKQSQTCQTFNQFVKNVSKVFPITFTTDRSVRLKAEMGIKRGVSSRRMRSVSQRMFSEAGDSQSALLLHHEFCFRQPGNQISLDFLVEFDLLNRGGGWKLKGWGW